MATPTVADLIRRSLQTLGVLAAGEEPTAEAEADAFLALNEMVDEWVAEGLDISSFIATTSDVDLAPGYARALRYNLAKELAPEYGVALSGEAAEAAATSLAVLKRNNYEPRYLESDPALLSPGMIDLTSLE